MTSVGSPLLLTDEHVRLESFTNWPVPHIVSPASLANAGFFYLNKNDQTQCAYCKGIIGKWEAGDNPDAEHLRHFPLCPYVQRVIRPRLVSSQSDEYSDTEPAVDLAGGLQELGISVHRGPRESEFGTLRARLETFSNWPADSTQMPEKLAEAGFYYSGINDNVVCFSCGGGMSDWLREDDPWIEHAKWYPKCNYLRLLKGEDFVKRVQQNEPAQKGDMDSNSGSKETQPDVGSSNAGNKSLVEENRILKDARLCKICMDNEISVIFLPCRHLVACEKCASSLQQCPICRKPIKATVTTFFS